MFYKSPVRNGIIYVLIAFVLFAMGYACSFLYEINKQEKTECGTIVSKSNDEVAIKHGSSTRLYLNIQYQDRFESQEVNPTTYFKFKKGDTVCFESRQNERRVRKEYNFLLVLPGLMVWAVLIFGSIIFGAIWLFDENDEE